MAKIVPFLITRFKLLFKNEKLLEFAPAIFLILLAVIFFWPYFLKGLVPIPADVIVGIYFPWRDQIWNGLTAGVPIKNGHLSDVVSIIYPWRIYGIALWKEGIAPLWIPHALAGMPLLANFQSGLAYPLNFFFWLFSAVDAWSWYIIIQPVLASLFAYWYLRNLTLSKMAALVGSVIFAYSGFSLVWLEYGIVGHAGLWLPLLLLSIDKFSQTKSLRWFVVGSLATGLSFLAGYPQVSIFSLMIAGFYCLFQLWREKKIVYLSGWLMIAVGLLLAAVQLIPGLELLKLSVRQTDPTTAGFNFGILPLGHLVLGLVPDFFGNPTTGNYWAKIGYNESAFYIGVAGIIFASIAFFLTQKKELIFFKVGLILSLLMAFQNPLAQLPQRFNLPGLATASAGRWLFVATFSLSVLAAYGVQGYLTRKLHRGVLTIIVLIVLIYGGFWWYLSPGQTDQLLVAKRNLILPSLLMMASAALLLAGLYQKRLKVPVLAAIVLLLFFDLARFGWKYNPFTEKNYLYPPTKTTEFLRSNSGLNRFYGLIPQSMFIPYSLSSVEGYEPLMLRRYSELANQINEEKLDKVTSGSRWVAVNRQDSPLLNLMGVKYLLNYNFDPKSNWDPQYFRLPQIKYNLAFQDNHNQVYENKESLPRAFIVHEVAVKKDREILKSLMNRETKPDKTLFLEEEPLLAAAGSSGEESAVIDEKLYWQNQVVIKTKSQAPGYLFLSDNDYPGWHAFIDGKETKIYRADYTFRSVFLPKGEHEIRFIFESESFTIGLRISLTTLLLLVVLLFYEKFKGRFFTSKRSVRLVRTGY